MRFSLILGLEQANPPRFWRDNKLKNSKSLVFLRRLML
jgi:hypothetical protein